MDNCTCLVTSPEMGHYSQCCQHRLTRNSKKREENPRKCTGFMGIEWLKIRISLFAYANWAKFELINPNIGTKSEFLQHCIYSQQLDLSSPLPPQHTHTTCNTVTFSRTSWLWWICTFLGYCSHAEWLTSYFVGEIAYISFISTEDVSVVKNK